MKPRIRELLRKGCMIEVAAPRRGRPGYRWVQGWEVCNPATGNWSVPMRYADALTHAREISGGAEC